jgi:hypothetical protein
METLSSMVLRAVWNRAWSLAYSLHTNLAMSAQRSTPTGFPGSAVTMVMAGPSCFRASARVREAGTEPAGGHGKSAGAAVG